MSTPLKTSEDLHYPKNRKKFIKKPNTVKCTFAGVSEIETFPIFIIRSTKHKNVVIHLLLVLL